MNNRHKIITNGESVNMNEEAAGASMATSSNFERTSRLMVSSMKDKFGDEWFANNYYRLYKTFANVVPNKEDWNEFLILELASKLDEPFKQLCFAYDKLIRVEISTYSAFEEYQRHSLSDWEKKSGNYAIKLKLIVAGASVVIVSLLYMHTNQFFFNWLLPFFIIYFAGSLIFANNREVANKYYGIKELSASDNAKKLLMEELLSSTVLKTQSESANELLQAIVSGKDYLVEPILLKWKDIPYAFGKTINHEINGIQNQAGDYKEKITSTLKFMPS